MKKDTKKVSDVDTNPNPDIPSRQCQLEDIDDNFGKGSTASEVNKTAQSVQPFQGRDVKRRDTSVSTIRVTGEETDTLKRMQQGSLTPIPLNEKKIEAIQEKAEELLESATELRRKKANKCGTVKSKGNFVSVFKKAFSKKDEPERLVSNLKSKLAGLVAAQKASKSLINDFEDKSLATIGENKRKRKAMKILKIGDKANREVVKTHEKANEVNRSSKLLEDFLKKDQQEFSRQTQAEEGEGVKDPYSGKFVGI
ncbi:MAG: hypothetical protein RIE06_33630 [Roseibium album]|uniref:hypothetical protein n=1 Tax=Roseibium album TaxID=311410 RepID=UPI0032EE0B58